MLFFPFLSAALAADPITDLAAQLDDGQGPAIMIACSPLGEVLPRLDAAADDQTRALLPPTIRAWLSMADPAAARAAGLDPDGGLLFTGDSAGLSLSLPFTGDDTQAEALLPQLIQTQSIEADHETGGWHIAQDGQSWAAALDDGRLRLDRGAITPIAVDAALLQDIPPAPGCAFLGSDMEKLDHRGVLAFIPLSGEPQPIRVRVSAPELAPPPAGSGPLPHDTYTDAAPLAVVVLRIDPLALMAQEGAEKLTGKQGLSSEDVRALSEKVRILPGTTLALFGALNTPTWAVTIPVADRKGRPLSARKLRRGLRKSELPLSWSSRTAFSGSGGKNMVYGALQDGHLVLSVDASLLAETLTDDGEPWVVAEHAEHSAEWPISARITQPPLSATIGAQVRDEYLEVSLELPEQRGELARFLLSMILMSQQQQQQPEAPPSP